MGVCGQLRLGVGQLRVYLALHHCGTRGYRVCWSQRKGEEL